MWSGGKRVLEFMKGLFDIFSDLKCDGTFNIIPLQNNDDICFSLSINYDRVFFWTYNLRKKIGL